MNESEALLYVINLFPLRRLTDGCSLKLCSYSASGEDCVQLSDGINLQCGLGWLPRLFRVDEYAAAIYCQSQPDWSVYRRPLCWGVTDVIIFSLLILSCLIFIANMYTCHSWLVMPVWFLPVKDELIFLFASFLVIFFWWILPLCDSDSF